MATLSHMFNDVGAESGGVPGAWLGHGADFVIRAFRNEIEVSFDLIYANIFFDNRTSRRRRPQVHLCILLNRVERRYKFRPPRHELPSVEFNTSVHYAAQFDIY